MDTVQRWLDFVREVLATEIVALGEISLTVWTLVYIPVFVVVLIFLASKLRGLIANRLLARSKLDVGTRAATASIVQYLILAIGFLVIIQTAGIDLTTLNVLAGALGIGAGFGLQAVISNFVAGVVILFERPVKIGDRIVVGDIEGDVVKISGRSTTVITNDNIAMIIPNSKFITEDVINWSHTDRNVRFKIPVAIAYGSDVRLVERLLIEVAEESPDVLDSPAPSVRFMAFGDSGLLFELRAWSTTLMHRKGLLTSNLNFGIYAKFTEHGIHIPFPQRDLHIKSTPQFFLPEVTPGGGDDQSSS